MPQAAQIAAPAAVAKQTAAGGSQDLIKLRAEIRRLESLIKKLQSDLASEREYSASLESQLRSLSAAE
jgi:uncharacterized protein YlxW (UPF0749 family)